MLHMELSTARVFPDCQRILNTHVSDRSGAGIGPVETISGYVIVRCVVVKAVKGSFALDRKLTVPWIQLLRAPLPPK